MTTLNLIHPAQSDIAFEALVFPDGQPHLKLETAPLADLDRSAPLRILTRLASANDLLLALYAKNTLDYLGFERVHLDVSYLMAARMDEQMLTFVFVAGRYVPRTKDR